MRQSTVVLVAVLALGGAFTASDALAGVNVRQRREQARIAQGVRSGELTRREAVRLEAQQAHIRREERRYRSDGLLEPWERADLRSDLDRASRSIGRQKNDAQER